MLIDPQNQQIAAALNNYSCAHIMLTANLSISCDVRFCCPLLYQFEYTSVLHHLFLDIVCKYDLTHKAKATTFKAETSKGKTRARILWPGPRPNITAVSLSLVIQYR